MPKRTSDAPAASSATKKKKPHAAAAAPPASIGDSLKDTLRSAQRPKKQLRITQEDDVATAAAAPPAAAAWETDESAPFPRGGGSALTPLEHKAIAARAKEDALFEVSGGLEDADSGGASAAAAAAAASGSGELIRAHALSRKHLVAGVRVLGAVSEVSSDRLVLQLPNELLGRVGREEVRGL
jgi:rRNA biogenesis protein RRP5